jgi:hypothetical protein
MSALTPDAALRWLDGALAEFAPRSSDQDITRSMLWVTTNIAREEREAFVGALRLWLQQRRPPALPLDLAVHHQLIELRPDLETVLAAMERGDGYPAYYREFVPPLRKRLEGLRDEKPA